LEHEDNEFTQLMKGLQGERLRQAFHHFDQDQDGFIKPEQFKRIILARMMSALFHLANNHVGADGPQTIASCDRSLANTLHSHPRGADNLFGNYCVP
jgi:hypothetical protein